MRSVRTSWRVAGGVVERAGRRGWSGVHGGVVRGWQVGRREELLVMASAGRQSNQLYLGAPGRTLRRFEENLSAVPDRKERVAR